MFTLSPRTKWNMARVIPFGIIWLVTGLVFLVSDTLAVGDNPVLEGAIKPNAAVFVFASVAITIMGLFVGFMEMVFVNRLFKKLNLWKTILYKFILYVLFFTLIMALVYPIAASIEMGISITDDRVWAKFKAFWGSPAFWSTGIQLTFSLLLSLIYAAISENLGHGVLTNFFMGKYHTPKQEERIFMFLDMKSSTTIAESLGHVRYFEFLQRYYDDFANAIIRHQGEVYQYVGDEIVITWEKERGLHNANCMACFFAMERALAKKRAYYESKFGYFPEFRAGLHMGMVTTGEVGALKKEIVFTGDVLNTAARIQGLCKELDQDFLVSNELLTSIVLGSEFEKTFQGAFELKGKNEQKQVYSIEMTAQKQATLL